MKNESVIEVEDKSYIKTKIVMLLAEKAIKNITPFICNRNLFFPPSTQKYLEKMATDKNYWKPQHLYFLSEEEIIKGDWIYVEGHEKVLQATDINKDKTSIEANNGLAYQYNKSKKIIASTDDSLNICFPCKGEGLLFQTGRRLVNGTETCGECNGGGKVKFSKRLSRPSKEFIHKYCKENGKIQEVLIEVEKEQVYGNNGSVFPISYVPKVSPDNTVTIKSTNFLNEIEVAKLFPKVDGKIVHFFDDKGAIRFTIYTEELVRAVTMHNKLIDFVKEFQEFNYNDTQMLVKAKELLKHSKII